MYRYPDCGTSARPERPLTAMRPQAHIPTGSPSPQAPGTTSTSAPEYHLPAPPQAELAPHQRHDPPAGQAVRPTETPSGRHQAPSPDPDPDPTHATVPAHNPRANAPGHELPTGVPHPEGGTPAARPAAAEGNGGTRALPGHLGGQPRPAPAPDGKTGVALQLADEAARAQPQCEEPTVDATEEAGGPQQRKEAPLPAADLPAQGPPREEIPSGVTGKPKDHHARTQANRPPDMEAHESSAAPEAEQPGTGPGGQTLDAVHAAAPPHQPHTVRTPRVTRAPPHPRPKQTAATQARWGTQHPGGHGHGAHLKATPGPKPGQPHPTCRNARPTGERRPVDTPARKTLSTPSWSPAGVPPTQTQRQLPRAATQSHETTIQGAQPSRYPARHTSSAILPPLGRELNTPPPQMTGTQPQAGQRTRPRTNRPGTAPKGAEREWRRAETPLASLPTSQRGPLHPGGGGI